MSSKNKRIIILLIGILILTIFFGIQSKDMESVNGNTQEFITIYLDGFQRYLFVITFIANLIIAVTYIPYFNTMIKIRIKESVFYYIWKKYFIVIILFTIYILFCFFIVSVMCNYNNPFYVFNFNIFFRIFMFILSNFVIYTIVYQKSNNVFLGIAINIAINFFILIMGIAYQYYITNNTMSENLQMIILNVYIVLINMIGMIYLFVTTDKKECLK